MHHVRQGLEGDAPRSHCRKPRALPGQAAWLQERLDDKALAALGATERRALAHTLLTELADFTRTDTATNARLQLLHDKADSAAKAYYRMQVRLGVVLRMRAILTSITGRVYLTQDGMAGQRQAYEGLKACEALTLGDTRVAKCRRSSWKCGSTLGVVRLWA